MVPSICPLETLHNSLSLKQVDDFLASIATSHDSLLEMSVCSPGNGRARCNTNIFIYLFILNLLLLRFLSQHHFKFSAYCLSRSCSRKESPFKHIHACQGFTVPFHSGCGKEVTRAHYIRHV